MGKFESGLRNSVSLFNGGLFTWRGRFSLDQTIATYDQGYESSAHNLLGRRGTAKAFGDLRRTYG